MCADNFSSDTLPAPELTNTDMIEGKHHLTDPSAGLDVFIPGFHFNTYGDHGSQDIFEVLVGWVVVETRTYTLPIASYPPLSITVPASSLGASGAKQVRYRVTNDEIMNVSESPIVEVIVGS